MRFILRKYVDADNASEALAKDGTTPVHDVYLKDGEEPKRQTAGRVVGFNHPIEPSFGWEGSPTSGGKR